jgi:hypothetical protein
MYGMIHRGLRQMVIDTRGEASWARLAARAGVGPQHLLTGAPYDDALTMAVVGACREDLDLDVDAVLETFGEYWVDYAASGPYARLMGMAGGDLPTFIENLDRLHQSVQSVLADARLPRFSVVRQRPGEIAVAYDSDRGGLEPFVKGLLKGLIARFGLRGEVSIGDRVEAGRVFEIAYAPGPS